ncbi:non-ribosomal peptide synthetase [Gynuella sunshinyii]|uniref:Non-ribosomal peptide synthetase modules-related protein n=1 Tax=Gynuella sunshinyii YC6258 TaxID=1445510 RepID=A0A0C5VCK7_9GAMM|nr:non-ribosomal peptide synthetase [Gynuella sunshinyii]AJQ97070.1 non-ribosomal peptide synthetase modules-related protein [Gynuella sunshinyii YC6258]
MSTANIFARALAQQKDLSTVFKEQLADNQNHLVFVERHGLVPWSYQTLYQRVERTAAALQSRGVQKGQTVLLCCDDEKLFIQGFWSILLAGAVAVPLATPLSFASTDEALLKILAISEQCQDSVFLTDIDAGSLARLTDGQRTLEPANTLFIEQLDGTETFTPVACEPNDLAMLMFSSGSTGDPKGACLSHKNLLTNLWQISVRTELTGDDRSLSWLPLTHDMGLVLFHMCHTLAGFEQYKMTPYSFVREPVAFLQLIGRERISIIGMPNFGFDTLLRACPDPVQENLDLTSLRVIYNGAEPINPRLVRRFNHHFAAVGLKPWVVSPGYGIAECCVVASLFQHSDLERRGGLPTLRIKKTSGQAVGTAVIPVPEHEHDAVEMVALGPIMAGMQVRISDDDGNQLGELQTGHISFAGANVSRGYWGKALTEWCSTGDIGFICNGELFISGRSKDVLFINGKNHYSNDLENSLCDKTGWPSNQLAVVGYRHSADEKEQVALFYRKYSDMPVQKIERLRSELESRLSYPVARVFELSALPKTTSGKIRRFQLRQGIIDGLYDDCEVSFQHHRDATTGERELWVWQQICDIQALTGDAPAVLEPLSHMGMDSVSWLQLSHRIEARLNVRMSLAQLVAAQHLQGIAALLPDPLIIEAPGEFEQGLTEVPLSENQYAIWTSYLLDEHKNTYNESYSLNFNAHINLNRFREAVVQAVRAHPMLNTIVDDQRQPTLIWQPDSQIDVRVTRHPDNLPELLQQRAERAFDLYTECPIRVELFELGNDNYSLLIVSHHLVTDGWSFSILLQDIFNAYHGRLAQAQSQGLWQTQAAEPADGETEYWRQLLKDTHSIDLPMLAHGTPTQTQPVQEAAVHGTPTHVQGRHVQGTPTSVQAAVHGTPTHVHGTPTHVQGTPTSVQGTPTHVQGTPASVHGTPTHVHGTPTSVQETPTQTQPVQEAAVHGTPTSVQGTPTQTQPVQEAAIHGTPTHVHGTPTQTCAVVKWKFDGQSVQRLQDYCGHGDLTVFNFLATAVSLLFSRLSGHDRVLLGTLVANRHHDSDARRVGYFAQTQAYVIEVDEQAAVTDLAASVAAQTYKLIASPALPLARLSQLTGVNIESMMEVVYVHQNTPAFDPGEQLQVMSRQAHRSRPRTGIYITSEFMGHDLECVWEYDATKYQPTQIHYYIDVFRLLIEQIAVNPAMPVRSLNWITPGHQAILSSYHRTDAAIDRQYSVVARFNDAVTRFAEQLAISDDLYQLSYAELQACVDALSHELVEQGISKGDRVCIVTDRSVHYVVAMLAVLQTGALFIPLDPALPEDRTRFIIADCQAAFLLTTDNTDIRRQYGEDYKVIAFDVTTLNRQRSFEAVSVLAGDGAYLIYTSGTTGRPKGVVNDHKSLANLVAWVADDFHYQPGETMCQFAPFSFDVSIAEILPSLCAGLHLYILPPEKRASPQAYLQVLRDKHVNVATVTPAFFYQFLDTPEPLQQCMADMRLFILGGEALKTHEVRRFKEIVSHVQLVNVYGPTETTVLSSFYFVPDVHDDSRQWQPLGRPIANTEFSLLTTQQQPTLLTQTGEIYIAGSGLSQGYWNDAEKTAAAFQTLTINGAESTRYYKTGDLARLSIDGSLEFVGRSDNQVKIRGFRIELGEIEKALQHCDDITQVVVVPKELSAGQVSLVAYYCGTARDKAFFNAMLSQTLPAYMLPDFYCHIDHMPLTHNGKIDHKQLPDISRDNFDNVPYEQPVGPIENNLYSIWGDILKLDRISRHANFFDIGGNSLLAARMLYGIKEKFHVSISLADIFNVPTLCDMAALIAESGDSEPLSVMPVVDPIQVYQLTEYPVSETQASMIFNELSATTVSLNNIPLTLQPATPIAVDRIRQALESLAARHPILGCRYRIEEGGITQQYQSLPLDFTLLQSVPAESMLEQARLFHRQVFDLYQGPLWRTLVMSDRDGRQWLNLSFHHSIADGVTLELFMSDLDSFLRQPSPLSADTQPGYGDYCLWLQQKVQQGGFAAHERYWQEKLADITPLTLPMAQPDQQSQAGEQYFVQLNKAQSQAFQVFCATHKVSPFVAFLAVYSVILGQTVQQNNFTIGVTLSGRSSLQQESIAGLFVNTLPLTMHIDDSATVAEYAQAVQQNSMGLMQYQDYPLVKVQRLAGRDKSLFNVLFNQEVIQEQQCLNGIPVQLIGVDTYTAKFPLTLTLMMTDTLQWRVEYQTARFSRKWVDELQSQVIDLIERTAEMSELSIGSLRSIDDELMALLES